MNFIEKKIDIILLLCRSIIECLDNLFSLMNLSNSENFESLQASTGTSLGGLLETRINCDS